MEIIKDFGTYNLPKSWNDLTLKQYENLERVYKEENLDVRGIIEALGEHSREEIDQLPIEFLNKLLDSLQWMETAPKFGEPTNKIEIDGEVYQVNVMEKLKTGEYIAIDQVLKSDDTNYAAILAILCRKKGEIYDSKFEAEELEKRIELFERQPMMNVMKIVSFFLNLYIMLEIPSLLSSELEAELKHIRKDIETSVKNGEHTRLWQKLQNRKLRKLEKSLKSISQTI